MGPRHLLRDRRSAARIEFALLTCLLFAIMLAALDFGMFFIQRGNLASGVATTAVYGFSNRAAVPFTNIPAMVAAIAGAPAVGRARTYGQRMAATDIVVTSRTMCNAAAGMVKVVISLPFRSPVVGLLPGIPAGVTATGCYPVL